MRPCRQVCTSVHVGRLQPNKAVPGNHIREKRQLSCLKSNTNKDFLFSFAPTDRPTHACELHACVTRRPSDPRQEAAVSPGPVLIGRCLHAHPTLLMCSVPAQRRNFSPFNRFHCLSSRLGCYPRCMLNSVHFYLKRSVAQTFCKIQVDGLIFEEFPRKRHRKFSPFSTACSRAPCQSSFR